MISGSIRHYLLSALMIFLAMTIGARAEGCVEGIDGTVEFRDGKNTVSLERVAYYYAVIGERDLVNSSGTRLTDYRAVIQQDRANLHKTGKADVFDTYEEKREKYFTTLERRSLLTTLPYYDYCWMSQEDITRHRQDIVAGHVSGALGVVIFRLPDGSMAITTSVAG